MHNRFLNKYESHRRCALCAQLVVMLIGSDISLIPKSIMEEVQKFYRLLASSDQKLHDFHRCDRAVGSDVAYVDEVEVQLFEQVLQ